MYIYMALRRSCCTPVCWLNQTFKCAAHGLMLFILLCASYTALIYCRQHNTQSAEPSTCVSALWAHVSYGQGVFLIRID